MALNRLRGTGIVFDTKLAEVSYKEEGVMDNHSLVCLTFDFCQHAYDVFAKNESDM